MTESLPWYVGLVLRSRFQCRVKRFSLQAQEQVFEALIVFEQVQMCHLRHNLRRNLETLFLHYHFIVLLLHLQG